MKTQLRASAAPRHSLPIGRKVFRSACLWAIPQGFLHILCILLLWLRPGFTQQLDNQAEPGDLVRGTVINKLTHEPISRALVYSPDNRFATLTDDKGHFEFKVPKQGSPSPAGSSPYLRGRGFVAGGPYRLDARKPGFLGDPVSRDVALSAGADATIFLVPEAIIQGRVLGASAEASPSFTVQLFARQITDGRPHWMNRGTQQTTSDGEFRFAELGPGEYKVMTAEQLDNDPEAVTPAGPLYGFPPSCFPGIPDFDSGATIQLAFGQTFDANITVARQPYFPVRIPLSGVDPGSGLNISVFAQGHPGPGYSLGYNPNQHRIEGLLPTGTYLVQATAFAPNQASGTVNITVAGRDLDGPILALASITPIPIHVKEEFTSTNPTATSVWNDARRSFRLLGSRAYLQVSLEPVEDFAAGRGGGLRPPASPDDVTLEITGAVPGRYWVHVDSSRGYPASITAGDVDLRQDPLVVSPGASSPIEITMRDDFATIEGGVAGRNSAAPATNGSARGQVEADRLVWVYCLPLSGSIGRLHQFASSIESKFTSPMVPPGSYRVLAFDGPHRELAYRDSEAMRVYDTLGQVINLGAGQTVHLELELIPDME